jgi:hypothetical protein
MCFNQEKIKEKMQHRSQANSKAQVRQDQEIHANEPACEESQDGSWASQEVTPGNQPRSNFFLL